MSFFRVQPVDDAIWPPEDQRSNLLTKLNGLGASDFFSMCG
jgi:hypothetical protein